MKILIAHMTSECNEHISHTVDLDEFLLLYGNDCINAMHIQDVFEAENIEIIPSIYASLHPNGMIKREAYEFIADKILETIKGNLNEIDGIYLQLHGASGIVDLEGVSGEHDLILRIRRLVGEYMPIAVVMDPHGNLTKTFADNVNIVRCYRESPHSDQIATERLVAEKLVHLLKHRRGMHPILRKLPIMVGGERSVSAKEPVRTINQLMDEAEKDSRVFSCSYHVGYVRHDDDKLGAAVVVIPNTEKDIEYCSKIADKISHYAWNHRMEFKFSGNFAEPVEAVAQAIKYCESNKEEKGTVVITDSGDNCGAGGYGQNTIMLQELLNGDLKKHRILIAGINDKYAHEYLANKKIGENVKFELGINEDEFSKPVKIQGTLLSIGDAVYGLTHEHVVGKNYTVRLSDKPIDIIVLDHNIQYGNMSQFEKAGLHFHDYDVVVVKMGYLDTYLIPETAYHIMALSDGPTNQRTENISFKKIARPMWSIDDFDELYYL